MALDAASSTRLGCGRDIDQVWESINEPPDSHEQTCSDCREARQSLAQLSNATAAQRVADLTEPDLQPSAQVLTRIMAVARAEVRRGRRLPLDQPDPGQLVSDLTVSEQTVSAVARRAGDAVPGVQVYRCRVDLISHLDATVAHGLDLSDEGGLDQVGDHGPSSVDTLTAPGSISDTRPAQVAVLLQISVSATASIPEISQQVRNAVIGAVNSEVGMETVRVEIVVRDIYDV